MKSKKASWRRFNKYLYKYRVLEATLIILGFITIPISLLNPYLTKLVIDNAYAKGDLRLFLILAATGGIIFLFCGLMHSLESYLSQRINRSVNFDITKDVFRHLQSLPLSFFNNESTSGHIYKISNDVAQVSSFVCAAIPQMITSLPRFLFTLIIVFSINWKVALFAFILVPITHIHSYFVAKWLKEMTHRFIEKAQYIFMELYEIFAHIHLVKAFGKEEYEIRKFEENLSRAKDFEINNAKLLSINSFSHSVIGKAITGIIALYGGYQVIKGTMTLGSLTAVIIYSSQLTELIRSIAGFYEIFAVNSVSCQRLAEILDIKPQIKDKENAIAYRFLQGRIEFRNVYFGYKEEDCILKGLSFFIPSNSRIALVGHSGCGKTTLISLILRLYEPQEGSILIDGLDIRGIKSESLKEQIGVALQEPFLLNDNIRNNILYAKENAIDAEVMEAAHIAEAHNFISGFPEKYDTQIGENACKISEGQKQRIAIARALIKRPKILILDEGLSSLDSQTEDKIIENLRQEFKDSTFIVVSHRLSTVQNMDLVYFLECPSSIEIGTHEKLIERNPGYKKLFASQIEPQEKLQAVK